MTCHEALRWLEFARPGATELEAADIARLETHLADCPACAAAARIEQTQFDRLAQAFQAVDPPRDFRDRLAARLSQARICWWKAIAWKSGLVVAVIGGGVLFYPAPKLDAERVANSANDQFGNQWACEQWLGGQNRRFQFPPQFQGKYLVAFERRDSHGTKAPVLTFVKRDSMARVTVLTPGQFRNLASFDGRAAENSSSTVLVVRSPEIPGVVYLVEVVNGPVEPFYVEDPPPVT